MCCWCCHVVMLFLVYMTCVWQPCQDCHAKNCTWSRKSNVCAMQSQWTCVQPQQFSATFPTLLLFLFCFLQGLKTAHAHSWCGIEFSRPFRAESNNGAVVMYAHVAIRNEAASQHWRRAKWRRRWLSVFCTYMNCTTLVCVRIETLGEKPL